MTEPTWSHPDDEQIASKNRKLVFRLAVAGVVGTAVGLYCFYEQGFLPRFAAVSGAAVGVLAFSTLRAVDNLRQIYRK